MLKLAIDVGGTRTDGVLLEQDVVSGIRVLTSVKIPTNKDDVTESVMNVVKHILSQMKSDHPEVVKLKKLNIHLGTTHFVNALKLRNGLEKVAVIRLALPASDLVPPFSSWPHDENSLLHWVYGFAEIVHGGVEHNGRIISKISLQEIEDVATTIREKDIKHVVLSAPNSLQYPEMEQVAQRLLKKMLPKDVTISLSQSFRGGGILQRENAAVLNAALLGKAKAIFEKLSRELADCGIASPLLVTRNDGSFMTVEQAIKKPFFAYSSGQINSIRGVGMMMQSNSRYHHALVVDIGGTTTDVGMLKENSPHMTNLNAEEEGVEVITECAHRHSIALGGDFMITLPAQGNPAAIGKSISQERTDGQEMIKPLFMGGDVFTLTDLSIIKNRLNIDGVTSAKIRELALRNGYSDADFKSVDDEVHRRVADAINKARMNADALPIVLCGGGACLIDTDRLKEHLLLSCRWIEVPEIIVPEHATIANAIGAAGATIRVTESMDFYGDNDSLAKADATAKAMKKAINLGADPTTLSGVSEFVQEHEYSIQGRKRITVVVEGKSTRQITEKDQLGMCPADDESDDHSDSEWIDKKERYKTEYRKCFEPRFQPLNIGLNTDPNIRTLSEEDINYLRIGAGYLGSGGGGDANIGHRVAHSAMRVGRHIQMIRDMNQLHEEDYVVVIGYAGMPEVLNEKIPSSLSGQIVINGIRKSLEKDLGRPVKLVAALVVEIGGANGLMASAQIASCGLPILDADTMGRAFPSILMTRPHIQGKFDKHFIVLAKEDESNECILIEGRELSVCQDLMNKKIVENGGAMLCALMPMTVKNAREWCVPGTISTAIEIGKQMSEREANRFSVEQALNRALEQTTYESCESLFEGTITSINRHSDGRHNFGAVIVRNSQGHQCEIRYKNENLVAWVDSELRALTPALITMVNPDTGLAFGSSSDYHVGLRVEVMTIRCPSHFLNQEGELDPTTKSILQGEEVEALMKEAPRRHIPDPNEAILSSAQYAGATVQPMESERKEE